MSLILDALNRSDTDRTGTAEAPGIHAVHGPGGEASRKTWQRFAWPGLTAVFAVLALLAWWGTGSNTDPAPVAALEETPEVSIEPGVPAPVAAPAEVRRQPTAQPQAQARPAAREVARPVSSPAPGFSDDVAALYSQMQAAGVSTDELVAPPPREQPASEPRSAPMPAEALAELTRMAQQGGSRQSQAQARSVDPEPAPAPVAREPSYDVDALARAARAEFNNSPRRDDPVVQHEAPFINELRQSQKDEIPSIFYSQHNWSSDPRQRSVILNGEERREGQQVKPGLRLVEILESSIVLDFRGTEFQLRSLNSWVNL